MLCPKCKSTSKVVEEVTTKKGGVRRKRRCPRCNIHFSTLEVLMRSLFDRSPKETVEKQ